VNIISVRLAMVVSALMAGLAVGAVSHTADAAPRPSGGQKSDACGARLAKPDGTLWSCTFHDDFKGTSLNRDLWIPSSSFITGDLDRQIYACYRDQPGNVSVSNGALHLTLRKESSPFACPGDLAPTYYSAGSVATYGLWSQQYGRFEARVKAPSQTGQGTAQVFWMWPDIRYSTINWPASGEIDVSQQFSNDRENSYPFLHYTENDLGGWQWGTNIQKCAAPADTWNTHTLIWDADRLEILVNGVSCLVNTSGDPAFKKRFIMILTQSMGWGDANYYVDSTPLPATMDVDYVRAWR